MKVTLLNNTPLDICAHAVRTCWQSFERGDNGGPKDKELIDRVGNKHKHASTLEHLIYQFYIQGISRAVLQELARHRIASLSVKSTRYTLKELEKEKPFMPYTPGTDARVKKYVILTKDHNVNNAIIEALENLRILKSKGIANDVAKYALPDAYKTELTWSINARSLQNFLSLRTDKAALWEIQDLAGAVYAALPEDHKYLFIDQVKVK